jgi:3-phenylpropionate/trans-cinnamate dioxygenase ferredoxin reductase component
MAEPFVIVGASLAGAKAAQTLREEGFDGGVVLIGDEAERPYERPPLSKDYLRGEAEDKPYVHDDAGYYAEHDIELRTSTTVEAIDPGAHTVTLAGGETLAYDKLLLTTGARPRRLNLPGVDLDGVHTLRTLADSDALRARLDAGARIVTIGAGWIGLEVAASARQKGCDATILEHGRLPLERILGPELGEIYRDVHTEQGARFVGQARIEAIEGEDRVTGVRLADGTVLDADVVVLGVGVEPRVELAQAAGLEVDGGILVDAHLRTSAPDVYAAGDVANVLHPLYGERVRVEHWDNAIKQGPVAARNMLGQDTPWDHLPYFFSDQYDVGMEYAGRVTEWDAVVIRGDTAKREFLAFWCQAGRVRAAMNVNIWDVQDELRALIRSGNVVDRSRLADPNVPLGDVTSHR